MIKDFIKWLTYVFSSKSRGYLWFGSPSPNANITLSRIYGKPVVYREKTCPFCHEKFYDYTGRKSCLRFRCFRRSNAK